MKCTFMARNQPRIETFETSKVKRWLERHTSLFFFTSSALYRRLTEGTAKVREPMRNDYDYENGYLLATERSVPGP